jgi:hypothetical protein
MATVALSPEAEEAIMTYEKVVSKEDRKLLAKMNDDPDRQKKWAVNPLMQYHLEDGSNALFEQFKRAQIEQYMLAHGGSIGVNIAPVVSTHATKVAPSTVVDSSSDSDDGLGGGFSIFD